MNNSLENVCRACLSSEKHSLAVFSELDDNLGNILRKCCDIEIKITGANNVICIVCKTQVLSFYNFRKQCQQSDSILRDYFENKSKNSDNEIKNKLLDKADVLQFKISEPISIPHYQIKNAKTESKSSELISECKIENELEFEELCIKEEDSDDNLNESMHLEIDTNNDNGDIDNTSDKLSNERVEISIKTNEININDALKINDTKYHPCNKCNFIKCKCNTKRLDKNKSKERTNEADINKVIKINDKKDDHCNKCNFIKCKCKDTKPTTEKKSKEKKIHKCSICNEQFLTTTRLNRHVVIHDCAFPFTCDQCGKCFAKYKSLQAHQIYHTGEKPHVCTICGWKFALSSNLTTHIRTHTGDKPFKCKECDKAFAQRSSLKSHSKCHTDERPFMCPICGKAFQRSRSYSHHMATHSDERRFECDICKKRFKNSSERSCHRKIHTEVKIHKCKECPKAFHRPYKLRQHEMTHSGEKPHVCVLCGKGFIQIHCLRTHMTLLKCK